MTELNIRPALPTVTVATNVEAAAYLVANTSLVGCVTDHGDQYTLVRPLLTLSSGELVLWTALGIIANGEELSVAQVAEAGYRLDRETLKALHDAATMARGVDRD